MTLHVPRRPYADKLQGIPTIRPFEARACGIPLVSAPWEDLEGSPGTDYLLARNGREMKNHIALLLHDVQLRRTLAEHGRRTILDRHTRAHRALELMSTCRELGVGERSAQPGKPPRTSLERPPALIIRT